MYDTVVSAVVSHRTKLLIAGQCVKCSDVSLGKESTYKDFLKKACASKETEGTESQHEHPQIDFM